MNRLYITTWVKRFSKKVSDLLHRKNFDWQELINTAVRESILTIITVSITILTMNLIGSIA